MATLSYADYDVLLELHAKRAVAERPAAAESEAALRWHGDRAFDSTAEYRSTTTNSISTMHEVTAVLTLLLSLVSAIGVLWIVLRLERVAGRPGAVRDDVRSH